MSDNKFTKADFTSDNEVRWCPGCGDYAILSAIQKVLPELGLPPEKHVFISGIGCAGRLPYYMNTYGFHTIHGRALAVATGLKSMRDDLSVWVITGDGDALSIGGNHFIHALRRNVNLNILLLNNQVYGLTKGQFSPTSKLGQVTKTSPDGVAGQPINPLSLAISSGATFVARAVDKDPKQLVNILQEAHQHQGCSFVEIYQDCHVFNNGAFDSFSTKTNRAENTLNLKHAEPFLYGNELEKALMLQGDTLRVEDASACSQLLTHNQHDKLAAQRLASITDKNLPVPLGVFYREERNEYRLAGKCQKSVSDLKSLYEAKASWRSD